MTLRNPPEWAMVPRHLSVSNAAYRACSPALYPLRQALLPDRVLFLGLRHTKTSALSLITNILLQLKAPEQPILPPGMSVCPISESWLQVYPCLQSLKHSSGKNHLRESQKDMRTLASYLVVHGPPGTWLHLDVWLRPEKENVLSGWV